MNRLIVCCLILWTASALGKDLRTVSMTLEHAGLDMSSAAGRREADDFARRAAVRWCRQFRNASRIDDRENFFACVSSAKVQVSKVTAPPLKNEVPAAAP